MRGLAAAGGSPVVAPGRSGGEAYRGGDACTPSRFRAPARQRAEAWIEAYPWDFVARRPGSDEGLDRATRFAPGLRSFFERFKHVDIGDSDLCLGHRATSKIPADMTEIGEGCAYQVLVRPGEETIYEQWDSRGRKPPCAVMPTIRHYIVYLGRHGGEIGPRC